MPHNINTAFDDHDYDQLKLLARMNNIKKAELVRRICKAYLDQATPKLDHEKAFERGLPHP